MNQYFFRVEASFKVKFKFKSCQQEMFPKLSRVPLKK